MLSQLLGAVAIIFDLVSFQLKDRRHIIICLTAACIFIGLHFYVLGQHAAAYVYLITFFRFCIGYFSNSKKWLLLFIPLYFVITAFNYSSYVSLLPLAAGILVSVATFCKGDKNMRLLIMASTAIWIVHNVIIFTPMGMLLESIFLMSNLVGYYRFYIRQQHRY